MTDAEVALLQDVLDFLAPWEGMVDNHDRMDPPYPNRALELSQRIHDLLKGEA